MPTIDDHHDLQSTQAMNRARRSRRVRAQEYELWLKEAYQALHWQLQNLVLVQLFRITRQLLMLLALQPHLLESFRRTLRNLPPGSALQHFDLDLNPINGHRDCPNPPDDAALEATATQLAGIVSSIDSLKILALIHTTPGMALSFLTSCSELNIVHLRVCTLETASIQAVFSIKTLQRLTLADVDFLNSESIDAFCLGLDTPSSLECLMVDEVFLDPEHEAQVAATLARSTTLLRLEYDYGEDRIFLDHYCVALSNNFDTKLEQLSLFHGEDDEGLHFIVEHSTASNIDAEIETKIRNLLKWNVQRKTCPPLFAAIGSAQTDAKRQQCLVDALVAVDIPVVFEYITANQNNLIELIQSLGRSHKRQREN